MYYSLTSVSFTFYNSYLNNLRTFHARLVDDEVQVSLMKRDLFAEGCIFDVVTVTEFLESKLHNSLICLLFKGPIWLLLSLKPDKQSGFGNFKLHNLIISLQM